MPVYSYDGVVRAGKEVKSVSGTVDADSIEEAASKIRDELGVFAHKIEPVVSSPSPPSTAPDSGQPEDLGAAKEGRVLVRLAELPAQTILDEQALAGCLQITRRTVRRMVRRFELPPPVEFGGRSTWMAGRVLEHVARRAERAARAAEREEQRLSMLSAGGAHGRARGKGAEEGKTSPTAVADTGLGKSPGEERI